MRHTVFFFLLACESEKAISTFNAPPAASITSHVDGQTIMAGTQTTFVGTVSDTNHNTDVLKATWYADDTVICPEATPQTDGSTTCETTITDDMTQIRLVVQDPEGEAGVAAINLDILESTPPVINLISPLAGVPYYSNQLITFSALISDVEDSPSALSASWESSQDGALGIATTPDSNGMLEGFTLLSIGTHVITLTVTDSSGLFTVKNEVIEVGDPNTPPACTLISPANSETYLSSQTIPFQGTATDAETPIEQLNVSWHSDIDGQLGTSNPSSIGEVLYNHPSLSVGEHVLSMRVEDEGGEVCTALASVLVVSAPTAQITSPANGNSFQQGAVISFLGLVEDELDAPETLQVEWSSDIDGVFSTQSADAQGLSLFSYDQLSPGTHNIALIAQNSGSQTGTDSISIVIDGQPTAPTVSITPNPATTTMDLVAAASGSIDPEGASVTYTYEWFHNGASTTQTSNTVIASSTQKGDTWTVRVTPSDGMYQGPYTEASITISNSPPSAPVVDITPTSPTEGVEDLTCTITAPSTDDDGDALTYTFEWYDGSGALMSTTSATTSTTDTISNSITSPGTWECIVYAFDGQDDGFEGSATVDVQSTFSGCGGGSNLVSMAPSGTMVLCDDASDNTCESSFENLCPSGWHLCTHKEFNNRNDGWTHTVQHPGRALGVRYCRTGSGAGHFTVPDASTGSGNSLGVDEVHNCYFGTSRPECTAGYGCNETQAQALCCSPNPLCGNGVVDSVEENCDDGNSNDGDSCLNVCDYRTPGGGGTNCGF